MSLVKIVMIGIIIILAVGMYCQSRQMSKVEPAIVTEPHISNITEIQEQLRDAGYYSGRIDGKWGKLTDRAYCNWCASKSFK